MDISETTGQSHKTRENNHISKETVLLLLFFALLFTNSEFNIFNILCASELTVDSDFAFAMAADFS